MAWRLTHSPDEFQHAAGALLQSDPARHTVPLTVLATLRESGLAAFGATPPTFSWHESGSGTVDGATMQTPPYPVYVAALAAESAASLIELLTADGAQPIAANVAGRDEADFSVAWAAATGGSTTVRQRSRLFRLTGLVPPDPRPPGDARRASDGDRDLLVDWHEAFGRDASGVMEDFGRIVADRLSHRGLLLWETGGLAVAMAGMTRNVAGVVRVAGVYTPAEHRRRGFGAAVTAAASQAALDSGAQEVVLFTDEANPTSNALYQRLGYQPISDRVLLSLVPAAGQPDVTGRRSASS